MFGMMGSEFSDVYRCHSVSLIAAQQQRDPARLESSDKIILPPSALEKLAHTTHLKRCRIIIDCTEFEIQVPNDDNMRKLY